MTEDMTLPSPDSSSSFSNIQFSTTLPGPGGNNGGTDEESTDITEVGIGLFATFALLLLLFGIFLILAIKSFKARQLNINPRRVSNMPGYQSKHQLSSLETQTLALDTFVSSDFD